MTREDVVNRASALFGPDGAPSALRIVDEYGTEAHAREVNRVKLAILQLSEGNREKLLYWTKTAKVDYRDPLAAQEPGSRSQEDGAKLQGEARRGEAKNLVYRWGKQ